MEISFKTSCYDHLQYTELVKTVDGLSPHVSYVSLSGAMKAIDREGASRSVPA